MKASIGGVYGPIWFGLKQTKSRVVISREYDPYRTKNQFKSNWFGYIKIIFLILKTKKTEQISLQKTKWITWF
jgi:hypothetical protein